MGSRWWIMLGGLLAALAVIASSYGAHGLDRAEIGQRRADDFDLAAQYQMIHAIGLVLIGLIGRGDVCRWCVQISGAGFLLGFILFCGGLFLFALWENRTLAPLIPVGGISFIVGWIALAIAGWKTCPTR
jgi:uncharacterized membrane protein YgdD (TMEM256/DUF423 family)